jgi:hypothetical protein
MKALEFEDVGRTFTCEAASSPATPGTLWWWVSVSGENQRYAAFRVEAGDTAATLRPRVLAYYQQILADRERPRITRPTWAQRKPVPAAAPAPAEASAEEPK